MKAAGEAPALQKKAGLRPLNIFAISIPHRSQRLKLASVTMHLRITE
jgi:hypothetical protein